MDTHNTSNVKTLHKTSVYIKKRHGKELQSNIDNFSVVSKNKCYKPVKNIYYAKIHKTGSECLVTLFRNFVRKNHLVTFPTEFDPFPGNMKTKAFKPPREHVNTTFNFFGEHARYKRNVTRRLVRYDYIVEDVAKF